MRDLGLQTPRLKRLAEIVSAQAIAQQEKLEYGNGDSFDEQGEVTENEGVAVEA
jgi:myosin V